MNIVGKALAEEKEFNDTVKEIQVAINSLVGLMPSKNCMKQNPKWCYNRYLKAAIILKALSRTIRAVSEHDIDRLGAL